MLVPQLIINNTDASYSHVVVSSSFSSAVVYSYFFLISLESLKRVSELTGREVTFYQVDLTDAPALEAVFEKVRSIE